MWFLSLLPKGQRTFFAMRGGNFFLSLDAPHIGSDRMELVLGKGISMKIEGTGKSSQTGQAKKKDKASGSGGAFGDMLASGASGAERSSGAQSVTRVDALLSVQAAEDPTERAAKKRMRGRADQILGELDKIRLGLLTGTLTVGDVINVADVVASHREKIMDPRLSGILDEIDLRAQVEIAKMRRAMDKSA